MDHCSSLKLAIQQRLDQTSPQSRPRGKTRENMNHSSRAILIILDGFGIGKDSPFNAIKNANMPFYRELMAKYPHSQVITHGEAVGLPAGIMGNSEVGHMTMGAGRIVYQDLTRISKAIREKT